jgi:hypothetical protein
MKVSRVAYRLAMLVLVVLGLYLPYYSAGWRTGVAAAPDGGLPGCEVAAVPRALSSVISTLLAERDSQTP